MWQVIGQDRAVSLLQRSLETGSLAHAYLFVGPPHVGKMTLALNLAQALNCDEGERPCGKCPSCLKIASANHADVQIIGLGQNGNSEEVRPRTEIGIDQIRQMQHSASLPPFEGKYKVFIIDEAEFLSNEAANCLLKTLEEPEDKVIFILLTTNESQLPATVVSRCQCLNLFPMSPSEAESVLTSRWDIEPARAGLLARFSHGQLGWAVTAAADDTLLQQRDAEIEQLLTVVNSDIQERFTYVARLAAQFNQNRTSVYAILDLWLDFWRDLMLVKIDCSDIIINVDRSAKLAGLAQGFTLSQIRDCIQSIQATREQLMQNANAQLALEVLMLDMPGKERGSERSPAARLR